MKHKHGKTPLALAPTAQASGAAKGDGAKKVRKKPSKFQPPTTVKAVGESAVVEKPAVKEKSGAKTVLGTCPKCGGDVIEGEKGFGCASWREGCHFVLWKTPICGKVLSPNQIKTLLKKGKTPLIKGFKSKSGKSFAAYLICGRFC